METSAKLSREESSRLRTEFNAALNRLQTIGHRLFTQKPFLKEIPEKGFVLATISGTSYIYTKISGARYRVALTADP